LSDLCGKAIAHFVTAFLDQNRRTQLQQAYIRDYEYYLCPYALKDVAVEKRGWQLQTWLRMCSQACNNSGVQIQLMTYACQCLFLTLLDHQKLTLEQYIEKVGREAEDVLQTLTKSEQNFIVIDY